MYYMRWYTHIDLARVGLAVDDDSVQKPRGVDTIIRSSERWKCLSL